MKRLVLIALVLGAFIGVKAQKRADSISNAIQKNAEAIGQGGNNEIKVNLLNAVIGIPEISYERLIGDNMGIGLSFLVGISDDIDYYHFGATPHFRVYFGAKKASGFFVEANTAIYSLRERSYSVYLGDSIHSVSYRNGQTVFGLGAAAGAKFLTRNGFLGEAYLGLGRFFDDVPIVDAYPRIGITIGKRF
jgi:hypothetical protein